MKTKTETTKTETVRDAIDDLIASGRRRIQIAFERATGQNYRMLEQLGWMDSATETIALGALAEKVVAFADGEDGRPGVGLVAAIGIVQTHETDALLNDHYRTSSSGSFHNAVEAAKRKAASYFVTSMAPRMLEKLAREEAARAAARSADPA